MCRKMARFWCSDVDVESSVQTPMGENARGKLFSKYGNIFYRNEVETKSGNEVETFKMPDRPKRPIFHRDVR